MRKIHDTGKTKNAICLLFFLNRNLIRQNSFIVEEIDVLEINRSNFKQIIHDIAVRQNSIL